MNFEMPARSKSSYEGAHLQRPALAGTRAARLSAGGQSFE